MIEVVGEDISEVNYRFQTVANTFASRGQKLIYWGPLKFLEKVWLRSPLVPLAYLASNVYHNGYWRNVKGKRRIREALEDAVGEAVSGVLEGAATVRAAALGPGQEQHESGLPEPPSVLRVSPRQCGCTALCQNVLCSAGLFCMRKKPLC